jgi:hypothetical protein
MRYIICIVALTTPAALWAGWESETVAAGGNVGDACSLAIDRWGRPHISYYDKTNKTVTYARYVNSAWEITPVAADVEVAGNTALALDAFDAPNILFQDDVEDKLIYAYRSGANWLTEEVESGENYGLNVSISAWPTGPHVAYTYTSGFTTYLKYGYRDGDGWETETVGVGGTNNKLLVDGQGTPHAFHGKEITIQHSAKENEDWETEDIAGGMYCHATLDPDGKFYASFVNHENTELYYAYHTGSAWSVEEATGLTGSPTFNQVCVNTAGDVYISYFDQSKADLHVMRKKGSSWTRELVADAGYVGYPHSSALGDDGYPLIAYYDAENGDLKLARFDPLTGFELTSFTARRTPDGVDIGWQIRRAEAVAGYNLYREAAGAESGKINDVLIEGRSPFVYADGGAPATECRYWLEAVATTGKRQTFGPATVPPVTRRGAFALHQNVPNPATGTTTFSFELAEGSDVKLSIYDAVGRKVADVAHRYFAAGVYDVPFTGEFAPGVYVYRLDAGSRTAARKMVVVK